MSAASQTAAPRPAAPDSGAAPKRASYNIASLMEEQAGLRPHQRAVVFPEGRDAAGNVAWTQLTYAECNRLTDEYARGFVAMGLGRGDRVSLLVRPCLEFIPLVFAVFKIGAIPVLIDPGMGRKQFLSCIERMAPKALIAIPMVHAVRGLVGKALKSVEVHITVGPSTWYWGGKTLDQCRVPGDTPFETLQAGRDDEAAILFTSGSTGPAKGVTYTHGIFQAQALAIRDMYDIQPGERDLACFPLFGLFSMAIGMTVVIPDMDPSKPAQADPAKLVEAIVTQGCTSGAGSPSIWKNVAPYCAERGITMPSLKRLLMFGAPIPVWMHEAFRKIMPPGAQIHTPYGATESLPVATVGTDTILGETAAKTNAGHGTCVGALAPGMHVRIIGISDEPIAQWSDELLVPQGQIGELVVRGEVVTHEYKGEPEQTAAAKITETLPDGSQAICHRMGDVGYLDEQGRIWFCGRKSHRVTLADGSLMFPVPVEGVFNAHPEVYRSALVGVGGKPVLWVEKEPGSTTADAAFQQQLKELGGAHQLTRGVDTFLFHPSFPVDVRHNAKIHRLQLRDEAAKRLGASA